MGVHVPQAGHEKAALAVDHFGIARRVHLGADRDDAAGGDQHGLVLGHGRRRGVEHAHVAQQQRVPQGRGQRPRARRRELALLGLLALGQAVQHRFLTLAHQRLPGRPAGEETLPRVQPQVGRHEIDAVHRVQVHALAADALAGELLDARLALGQQAQALLRRGQQGARQQHGVLGHAVQAEVERRAGVVAAVVLGAVLPARGNTVAGEGLLHRHLHVVHAVQVQRGHAPGGEGVARVQGRPAAAVGVVVVHRQAAVVGVLGHLHAGGLAQDEHAAAFGGRGGRQGLAQQEGNQQAMTHGGTSAAAGRRRPDVHPKPASAPRPRGRGRPLSADATQRRAAAKLP